MKILKHCVQMILILSISLVLLQQLGCSPEKIDKETKLELQLTDSRVGFPAKAWTKTVDVETNADQLTFTSSADWCNAEYDKTRQMIVVSVQSNVALESRTASIVINNVQPQQELTILQFGVEPALILESEHKIIDYKAQRISVEVLSNIDIDAQTEASWIKRVPELKSVRLDPVTFTFEFDIESIKDKQSRQDLIVFAHQEGEYSDTLVITQSIVTSDYQPGDAQAFERDKEIELLSAELTPSDKYQSHEGIDKSIDGDVSTFYHSPWSGMANKPVITLEYTLNPDDAKVVNYVVLQPRTSGYNGVIKSGSVWVSTAENAQYVEVASIEASLSNKPVVVRFDTPIINPRKIKVEVTDAYTGDGNYYVSLAEFQCYESRAMKAVEGDLEFFTDVTCSQLKESTTVQDLSNIQNPFLQNIAAFLMADKYEPEFRVQTYEPYREIGDLAEELKTSAYSQFENPTGMYFEANEQLVVFVGETHGEDISLRIRDFGPSGNDFTYPLFRGVNVLTTKGKGNAYVNFYTPNYQTAEPIKVHIASGKINGYFNSSKHNEEDGKRMLDAAVSEIFDVVGERTHLAYSVNSLKNYNYGHLQELIGLYDQIVYSEQEMMGLVKYNRLPKNHMFGRVIWDGYMHADGFGAAFHENTMSQVGNYARIKKDHWGISHEFGHVNQVRPGMKWVGTTEVTNNIFSVWINYCFEPDYLRLEHQNVGGVIGGRYNAYFTSALLENQEWGIQAGPDASYGMNDRGAWSGDVFVSLIPLWQMHLYFHLAGEGNSWHKPFFWADIFEAVRNTDERGLTDGQLQINFVKNACDAVQLDLSDFFLKVGMLSEIDKKVNDYTLAQKTITKSMIDEAVNYARQYPKPATDFIHYISGNSIEAYQGQLAVKGQYNTGIRGTTSKEILHSVWQNVTVFETYANDVLTHITMVGTGSADNSSTKVPYPESSTRIEAVAFDGTRTLVCGQR